MDKLVELLKDSEVNTIIIIGIMCLGYILVEGIKCFYSEVLLNIKKINDKEMQNEQQSFQTSLAQFNADLQEKIQTALEEQRVEFQKELKAIDYKNDYYKKIIDKRIEAYEDLNELVLNAILMSKIEDYVFCSLFSSYEKFSIHYNKLKPFSKNFIWYSPKIVELLNKYIIVFSSIDSYYRGSTLPLKELSIDLERVVDIENNLEDVKIRCLKYNIILPLDDNKLCSAGIICHDILSDLHIEIIRELKNDFKRLYEVEEFLNQQ